MEEVKKILKNQLDREKESIKRELTLSNLDAIYKITGTLCNIHELECAEMPTVLAEASENLIKKYSNGKYDKMNYTTDTFLQKKHTKRTEIRRTVTR